MDDLIGRIADRGCRDWDFAAAIKRVGETPCDRYKCALRVKCATELLACSAFRWYVRTGKAASPNDYIPVRESPTDRRRYKDAPEPSREIYDRLAQDNEDGDDQKARVATRIVINGVESRTDVEIAWK